MSNQKAFRQAYNLFDPELPLIGDRAEYYIERKEEQVSLLKDTLLFSDQPAKLLLTGHRGCGKTTELLNVFRQLEPTHFPIWISALDILEITDIKVEELLLAMSIKLYQAASEAGLQLSKDLLRDLVKWFAEVTRIEFKEVGTEAEFEAGVKAYFVNVLSKLRVEAATRVEVRERARRQLSELIDKMNALISEVETRSGRRVLLGVDDLDKPDLALVQALFKGHSYSLAAPECKIVYTVPLPLIYTTGFPGLARFFALGDAIVVPVTRLVHRDGRRDKDAFDLFRQVVAERVPLSLFLTDTLDTLIWASGGDLRQFVDLVRYCCLKAAGGASHVIDNDLAALALTWMRNRLRRQISSDDFDTFRSIQRTSQLAPQERARYLDQLTVFEYLNDELWYDIHPLLDDILPSQVEEAK